MHIHWRAEVKEGQRMQHSCHVFTCTNSIQLEDIAFPVSPLPGMAHDEEDFLLCCSFLWSRGGCFYGAFNLPDLGVFFLCLPLRLLAAFCETAGKILWYFDLF